MKQDILNLKDNLQDQGWLVRSYRKHNIMVYGLNEDRNDGRWDLCYKLLDLINNELKFNICDYMVDDCYRLGKKRNRRSALISFTSTLWKRPLFGFVENCGVLVACNSLSQGH